MKFFPELFNDPIWIYDVHSIRILFYQVVRHYFAVKTRLSSRIVRSSLFFSIGFGDRLLGELKRIAPKEVKIKISAPRERLYSTWIG